MSVSPYRTALVTGATSGIGAAVARSFRGAGLEVHALGRNRDALDQLAAECGCIPHLCDVRDGASLAAVVSGVEVDVLVNAAGINLRDRLADSRAEDVAGLIETNLSGLIELTRLCLAGMIKRDQGHIVNLGSISGLHNFEGTAIYHATKAAVHAFSGQLRQELLGSRVRVTEIAPARVATDIFNRVFGPEIGRTFTEGLHPLEPADVAEAVMFAVRAPWHVSVTLMEMWPTHQAFGALRFVNASRT